MITCMTLTGRSGWELVCPSLTCADFYISLMAWQLVQALSRKYKAAKASLQTVQVAFKDLTSAIGSPSWIKEWEQLEAKAVERRGEAMMIYNVSPIQGIFGCSFGLQAH